MRVYQCAIHVYSTTTVKPAGGGAEHLAETTIGEMIPLAATHRSCRIIAGRFGGPGVDNLGHGVAPEAAILPLRLSDAGTTYLDWFECAYH